MQVTGYLVLANPVTDTTLHANDIDQLCMDGNVIQLLHKQRTMQTQ